MSNLNVKIVGERLPGRSADGHDNVHVGLQRGDEVVQVQPADGPSVKFSFGVVVREVEGGDVDVRSPFAHGKPGDRFFYLVWGSVGEDGTFDRFARIKLMLAAVPKGLLTMKTSTLEGYLPLTKADGKLVYASVRPPDINWSSS